jgi:hypothetical protein
LRGDNKLNPCDHLASAAVVNQYRSTLNLCLDAFRLSFSIFGGKCMNLKQTHARPAPHSLSAALLALVLFCLSWTASAAETRYQVDLSERAMQQVTIEARFSDVTGDTLDFHLPIWRSGLYLVMDFVGTVSGMQVSDGSGNALPFEQTATSSWRVSRPDAGNGDVVVRYRVYADSLNDRTRHVDAEHAFLNPAAVFVYADALRDQPLQVTIGRGVCRVGYRFADRLLPVYLAQRRRPGRRHRVLQQHRGAC